MRSKVVNIVKGPAPAVYGASQNVGGFIDLIAKQPYFDRFRAEIDATFGEYDLNRYIVDFGAPIIPEKLAFRISFPGKNPGAIIETFSLSLRPFMRSCNGHRVRTTN